MHKNWLFYLLIVCILAVPNLTALAQDQSPGPIYIVAPGDTINLIAQRFGVSVNTLIETNGITNPDLIPVGFEMVIPGLEGISGTLTTHTIELGETLQAFAILHNIPIEVLVRLNRITIPSEIYTGSTIVFPENEGVETELGSQQLPIDGTLLEEAVLRNTNTWELMRINQQSQSYDFLSGMRYFYPLGENETTVSLISPLIQSLSITPLPLIQGATIEIQITTVSPTTLSGTLDGHPLHFFQTAENQYVSLQGISAERSPGLGEIQISGETELNENFSFNQNLLIESAGFGEEVSSLPVDPITIDPTVTEPENQLLVVTTAPATSTRFWDGMWGVPTDNPDCIYSRFGTRRSYNGSEDIYIHTGVDYGVCTVVSLNIYASAPGVVVFAGPLTVRGNATIIDHGWGVYSAYYHMAEINVQVGDEVQQGQLLGIIGATGRVTGPHLHFEVWVNGVQVQPLDWLENTYP